MTIQSNYLELAKEIKEFLSKHAKKSAIEPNEYNSPDAYQLLNAANLLEAGKIPDRVLSFWGSGGYAPINDDDAREWHESILKKIIELR